jgi:hypothetical protein
MIKLRKIRWGPVASMGKMRNTYKVLIGKPKKKEKSTWKIQVQRKDNIKMGIK